MRKGDKHVKIVEWSDEEACFIGSCPELFYGGCHGQDAKTAFAGLCAIVKETIRLYVDDHKPIPAPMSGREFVNAMQRIA